MKKTIAILTVLILALTCVFAADPVKTDSNGTATIHVKQLIKPVYPTFQLATASVAADVKGTAKTHELTADSLLTADATVAFTINQKGVSKCFAIYDITVTATDMILMKDDLSAAATKTDYGMDDDQWAAAVKSFALASGSATPAVTAKPSIANGTKGVAVLSASNNVLTVQYLGGIKSATVEPLGTFSVTWSGNALAIPGTYQADVQIEVEAQ